MINLKDLLRSGRPEDENRTEEGGMPDGETLVPDFTAAEDYIDDVEQEVAEHIYSPSEAYVPEPESAVTPAQETAISQPAYRSEQAPSYDDDEDAGDVPTGVSLISRETTVLGDIVTEGHIDIVGKVRGNVEAEGNVAIRGLVSGDVSGEKIGLYKCRVKGDLTAETGVVIDADSVVIGDVDTEHVVLGGKLKGDIKAMKMAVLRSDAYFIGDVETESLAVESGAVVNGNIKTRVQGDLEAPFDD